ncbi:MAG TPA: phosphotransferase family protein [Actinomycetota bacterium]|nr:phosphotransferase family protein [Actinomycetota bacterium]
MSAGPGGEAALAPAGILADGVTRWFAGHVPGVQEPLAFERIAGGQSNLTYAVTDQAGGRWVLRRPPLSGVLPSAHDMAREHRIIAALAATDVPVPRAFGLCDDESVTGAPFYVMEHVDGVVPRDEATVVATFGLAERAAASTALVDALVALHRVEPEAVGLGQLGRGHGYVERQLARWRRQWEQSRTRELPAVEEVHRRLTARVPAQERVAIVHGDYRLDNLILSPAGEVRAVIDWELSTLGDPRADLGLLLVYWAEADDEMLPLGTAPTRLPGFPTRAEVAAAYADGAGRSTDDLEFFVALGYWKLAVILEGVYARYAAGAYGQADQSWREFPAVVTRLADLALAAVDRTGR